MPLSPLDPRWLKAAEEEDFVGFFLSLSCVGARVGWGGERGEGLGKEGEEGRSLVCFSEGKVERDVFGLLLCESFKGSIWSAVGPGSV